MEASLSLLSRRLDSAEEAFIQGKYASCLEQTQSLLRDVVALTTVPTSRLTSSVKVRRASAPLQADQHLCTNGCLCHAAVILCIQCLFEMQRFSLVEGLLLSYYSSITSLPYEVFIVWVQLQLYLQHTEDTATSIVKFLKDSETKGRGRRITNIEYEALVELLVFHCMVPIKNWDEAIEFLRNNTRIRPEIQEGFLYYLTKLEAGQIVYHEKLLVLSEDPVSLTEFPLPSDLPSSLPTLSSDIAVLPTNPKHPTSPSSSTSSSLPSSSSSSSSLSPLHTDSHAEPSSSSLLPLSSPLPLSSDLVSSSRTLPLPPSSPSSVSIAASSSSRNLSHRVTKLLRLVFARRILVLFIMFLGMRTMWTRLSQSGQIVDTGPLVQFFKGEFSKFARLALSSGFGRIFFSPS